MFTNSLLQDDHEGWKSWKISYFLNWAGKAGKAVLYSNREAGKAEISTCEILKNFFNCFFE